MTKTLAHQQVLVKYPDTFPLSGAELALFDFRLKKMFRYGWVSISDLRNLRSRIGLDPHPNTADADNLDALHCEKFAALPPEVLRTLPDLVGRFLDVTITVGQQPASLWPTLRNTAAEAISIALQILAVVAILVLAGVVGWAVSARHLRSRMENISEAASPAEPAILDSNTDVLDASLDTVSPAKAINKLSATIKNDGRLYKVHLVVSRGNDSK